MIKKTLVLGASENPERYSNMAIKKLRNQGHEVIAIGKQKGKVEDVEITCNTQISVNVDTVSIYLNILNQKKYEEYILSLHPRRIIFNPGAENPELAERAKSNHIQVMDACTLVLLSTGQY
ncbi:MAG TPA: CoA-binding protein [Niabella sp.]|nr:CoA-binding protein [Niabella sp.]HOZ97137.1 CoA-binding protein [Niabella sp.]HQW15337.1 CoA-binding protein [Niabella sp.]HQX20413.1 CoA-binding protein [Niabella sp.]HQX41002.1 CoA-binding protein [Niabella sp.]